MKKSGPKMYINLIKNNMYEGSNTSINSLCGVIEDFINVGVGVPQLVLRGNG